MSSEKSRARVGKRLAVPAGPGSLLDQLRLLGRHPRADCGGDGRCGKCRVRILARPPAPDPADSEWLTPADLDGGWRLACRHSAISGAILESDPDWHLRFRIERGADFSPAQPLGIAADIGTTGLVSALVDMRSGEPLIIARGYNPQRAYGADVMTRLVAARDPSLLKRMQSVILEALQSALDQLAAEIPSGISLAEAPTIAVGNTVMLHLACGLPETTLSVAPFRSPLEGQSAIVTSLRDGSLSLCGPLQGFIGSDLLAVLNYLNIHQAALAPTLVMDLGTNSEIALWDGRFYWVISCAAGPAFEGGGISCGAPAGPGIATGVIRDAAGWKLLPPSKRPKSALCGSALIALLAELIHRQMLRSDGKFTGSSKVLLQDQNPEISLNQKDVRALQLAKAAIHAGVVMLSRRAGLALSGIGKVVITGAFARDLQEADLKEIGLVPAMVKEVAFLNDGALLGAAKALPIHDDPFRRLRGLIKVVNLVEEDDFQERFLEGLELKPLAG
ncbi:MAG TPA: ASKHA domain-containing protein [bacterium]